MTDPMSTAGILQWASYCCLRVGVRPRRHRRQWSLSALLSVDHAMASAELRQNLVAFRIVFQARKLIETGMLAADYAYVVAARRDLLHARNLMEIEK